MAQRDLLNRSLETGKDVTQKTQERIESLLRDFSKTAEEQAAQAQQLLQDLVERSRANTEQLVDVIEREIRSISHVSVPTRADIEHLISRVTGRADEPAKPAPVVKPAPAKKAAAAKSAAATPAPAKKKAAAEKPAAKKAATKKAATKKASAEKDPAKKVSAKKASATKASATKASAKKASAKKAATPPAG